MSTKLIKTEFVANVIALMSGTTIAQVLPVLIAPILTRLYTPTDFGVLALFSSFVVILTSISSGRYELAIILPKKDIDAFNVLGLSITIAFTVTSTVFFFLILFKGLITDYVGKDMGLWMFFIPIGAFLGSFHNSLKYYSIRQKKFWAVSRAIIIKSVSLMAISLGVGYFYLGPSGLILGQVFSLLAGNIVLYKNATKDYSFRKDLSVKSLKELAVRYLKFPKFSLPAGFSNALSFNLNKLLIPSIFSTVLLGYYNFIDKILGAPSMFIGNALGQVFFQKAASSIKENKPVIGLFDQITKYLILIGFAIYLVLAIICYNWFGFIFGEKWVDAGALAIILIPFLFIRFVVAPLTVVNNVFETQKFGLIWQFGKLVVALIPLIYASIVGYEFRMFLILYSFMMSVYYILVFFVLRGITKGKYLHYFR